MSGDSHVSRRRRPLRDDIRHGGPPAGARILTAILPNGRSVWLNVAAPLATASSVADLAQTAGRIARHRRWASTSQHQAIRSLRRRVDGDSGQLAQATAARADRHRRRILERYRTLDRRVSKAAAELRQKRTRQLAIETESIKRLQRRNIWDRIVIATSLPLFAAYGQHGNPFGVNNLTLVLSLLVWLVGDEVFDLIFGDEKKSPYPLRDADAWSYIAPAANLLSGWWLLGDTQHQRFIAGVAPVSLPTTDPLPDGARQSFAYVVPIMLDRMIKPDTFSDFVAFAAVPVVATFGAIRLSADGHALNADIRDLSASVAQGQLLLSFRAVTDVPGGPQPPTLGDVEIGWIVDTAAPAKPS